jgi:hypothetical protein
MRTLLIALLIASCGYKRFEVRSAPITRTDVATRLRAMHWDIETANESEAVTEWHRLRLRVSAFRVNEVQMRIRVDLRRGTAQGFCIQRTIKIDGSDDNWHFRPCTDLRALRMIGNAINAISGP